MARHHLLLSLCIVVAFSSAYATRCEGRSDPLPDAPRHFRFYSRQLEAQAESVGTLRGVLIRRIRSPVDEATAYYARNDGLGPGTETVKGDYWRIHTDSYHVVWDISTDRMATICQSTDNPLQYIRRDTGEVFKPSHLSVEGGLVQKYVENRGVFYYTDISSVEKYTRKQVFIQSQVPRPVVHGSPRRMLYENEDASFSRFFAWVADLAEKDAERHKTYLDATDEEHTLTLVATSGSRGPITYEWVFDATNGFRLLSYTDTIAEIGVINTRSWEYNETGQAKNTPFRFRVVTTRDGEFQHEEELTLTDFVVGEAVSDEDFGLAAMDPSNGDIVIEAETGVKYYVQDNGHNLVSFDSDAPSDNDSTRVMLFVNLAVVGVLVALLIWRKIAAG